MFTKNKSTKIKHDTDVKLNFILVLLTVVLKSLKLLMKKNRVVY